MAEVKVTTELLAELEERASVVEENDPGAWEWDRMKIEEPDEDFPGGYIWVPQGSTLGDTLIQLGDTYEGGGEDCAFIQRMSPATVLAIVEHIRQDAKAIDVLIPGKDGRLPEWRTHYLARSVMGALEDPDS